MKNTYMGYTEEKDMSTMVERVLSRGITPGNKPIRKNPEETSVLSFALEGATIMEKEGYNYSSLLEGGKY